LDLKTIKAGDAYSVFANDNEPLNRRRNAVGKLMIELQSLSEYVEVGAIRTAAIKCELAYNRAKSCYQFDTRVSQVAMLLNEATGRK
jgi:NADH:ubiquinone oxidoreductase subunit E